MNDIEYLNKIAKDNRAVGTLAEKDRILSPKIIKIIIGAVAAVILMMILGGILGNLGNGERDLLDKIYLRSTNLNTSVTEYQDRLKSSELRSLASSLSTLLSDVSSKTGAILKSEYDSNGEPRDEKIKEDETEHLAAINSALNYGKINGLLDRYFAREMSREIVLLQSLESEALEKTSNSTIKDVLVSSWNNLQKIETDFDNFQSI